MTRTLPIWPPISAARSRIWAIWPGKGTVSFGASLKDAGIVADIAAHTVKTIQMAEALGGWTALGEKPLFEIEYWELEQAKLRKGGGAPPLQGKIALVTGASAGIGRACAQLMAERGAEVVALGRTQSDLDSLRAEIGGRSVTVDLADPAASRAAMHKAGTCDYLINSAGIIGQGGDGPGAVDYGEWARVLDVNTFGPVRVLDAFFPRLAAAGGAKAITLTSGYGSIGDAGSGGSMMYRTSKAAVNMAMRARSFQLRAQGIVVAVINPGWVRTDMGGPGARISAEESVRAMREVIAGLTVEDTGSFRNWNGREYPW